VLDLKMSTGRDLRIVKIHGCRMLLYAVFGVPRLVVGSPQSRSRQTRDWRAQESPGDVLPGRLSIKRSVVMSFTATFVSIAS